MLETRHHWLPVFIAIYLPISFIITYSIAVGNDHVEPGFPYISDTGTKSPESCVFGQLLNIGAVISGFIVYIRYRHIHTHFMDKDGRKGMLRLNVAAFTTGMLAHLGISIVGNFQSTNINSVHLIGAFLAFGVGFLYMILQTIISYKTVGKEVPGSTLTVRILRTSLCVADGIFLIIFVVNTVIAERKGPSSMEAKLLWSSSDPGHTEHVIATASEWMVAFVSVAFYATFYSEFKHFKMKPPEVAYYDPVQERQHQATPISIIS